MDAEVDGVRCLLIETRQPAAPANPTLSPREKEVANMVAAGYPNKTVAAMLKISSWTVSTYLRRIFVKLGVHSRTAMVTRLFEEGLISEPAGPRPLEPWRADEPAPDGGGEWVEPRPAASRAWRASAPGDDP
jgi:DNA-binding CsgD family transcriptional regulator